jgi:hypothetical protein
MNAVAVKVVTPAKQIEAHRRTAQLSTGVTSPEGKAAVATMPSATDSALTKVLPVEPDRRQRFRDESQPRIPTPDLHRSRPG